MGIKTFGPKSSIWQHCLWSFMNYWCKPLALGKLESIQPATSLWSEHMTSSRSGEPGRWIISRVADPGRDLPDRDPTLALNRIQPSNNQGTGPGFQNHPNPDSICWNYYWYHLYIDFGSGTVMRKAIIRIRLKFGSANLLRFFSYYHGTCTLFSAG